jgi:hypothetical protein
MAGASEREGRETNFYRGLRLKRLKLAFSLSTFLMWTAAGAAIGIILFFAVAPPPGSGGEPSLLGMAWGIFGVFVLIFGWIPLRWFYCYAGCRLFPQEIARLVFINWVILGMMMGVIRGFIIGRKSMRAEDHNRKGEDEA